MTLLPQSKFSVIRLGEHIATIEAATLRDAQIVAAERFGDGAWLIEVEA